MKYLLLALVTYVGFFPILSEASVCSSAPVEKAAKLLAGEITGTRNFRGLKIENINSFKQQGKVWYAALDYSPVPEAKKLNNIRLSFNMRADCTKADAYVVLKENENAWDKDGKFLLLTRDGKRTDPDTTPVQLRDT